ncbi:MAG: ribosome maturation factor RimM [Proteobacteria bacterium]|nr:ribosome maturation factor RimM [Pseudomonadota bacterium]
MATGRQDRVCIGAIAGVRGLKGEVRIKSFTADPNDVAAYGPVSTEDGETSYRIKVTAHAKGLVIARLDGIADRDAAEALKGARLYVAKDVLPEPEEGEYYHADLIGLTAETEDGEHLGTVKAVHNFGASDILEIGAGGDNDKDDLMVPFTADTVPVVDIEKARIVVKLQPVLEAGDEAADNETNESEDAHQG